jgi:hypothetical protein
MPNMTRPPTMITISRLARTGLKKRLGGGSRQSLRSDFAISERIGLCGGALILSDAGCVDWAGAAVMSGGLLTGACAGAGAGVALAGFCVGKRFLE